ncbi:MAG: NADH-quinone oxidoreductase subunit L [Candidatus Odinarchaeota archaeon]|nr:NADH-quinone oxidoreductase subunit L [Candidatus Odinarchaeota archaeon]
MDYGLLVYLAVGIPMLGAFLTPLIGKFSKKLVGWYSTILVFISAGIVFLLIPEVILNNRVIIATLSTSIVPLVAPKLIGNSFTFYVDALSLIIGIAASFFGAFDLLYSTADMAHEEGIPRFYFLMLTFIGSMIGLAFAGDLILLFIFWEIVGICSYSLIGFYYKKPESLHGSFKAIMLTHAGGVGLLIGAIWTFFLTRTTVYSEIPTAISQLPEDAQVALNIILALYLVAAMAKSVQFPIHTWLPDATVAPSPVTALLHAAAMVKAGVYLIARVYLLYPITIQWNIIVSTVGIITMAVASFAMIAQNDVKRLLAYSTITQIGYMFFAIGIGTTLGIAAGLFHLFNHVFIKGLLFLGAGCLIYATKTKDLRKMGGLARNMPVTAASCIIGALAISGIPPLNGFVSKFMIYEAAISVGLAMGGAIGGLYLFYGIFAIFASAMTFAGVMKFIFSAFFGSRPTKLENVKEVPIPMQVTMVVLAIICIIFGIAPYIPLNYLIIPAAVTLAGGTLTVSTLGYVASAVGGYYAALIVILLAFSLLLGFVVYKLGTIRYFTEAKGKFGIFTGGEIEEPYLSIEKTRPDPSAFFFSPKVLFGRLYKVMEKGGLDRLWFGIGRALIWFSNKLRRIQIGYLNVYIAIAAIVKILIYLLMI